MQAVATVRPVSMISLFRSFAKSPWAIGLFALLILSFVVVGTTQTDVFSSLGPKHVISAGDRSVTEPEFRAEMERVRNNLQEQAGRPVTFEDMVAENIHVQYVEGQTQRLGFMDWAWKAGIRPGAELVAKQIREIPAFFNQVTGQFDQEQYETALSAQNITPAMLEEEFRDQYINAHFASAVFAGTRAPRIYGALLAGQALETRDGRWFTVTQAMAGTTAAPTDAQLTAFLNENAAQLRQPEFRIVSVVLFNPGPNDAAPQITEDRIVERFEFRRAALSQPERRTFVSLTTPDRATADRIATALKAGQDPNAVAEANDITINAQDSVPQTAITDPAVAQAVFALGADQVSDPIQARVGFTVAKVRAVTAAQPATLESARAAIIDELGTEDIRAGVYAKVERYEAARQNGQTLADAAQAAGGRIVALPPFTQDGRLPDGEPMNAPPQIIETAYALAAQGAESDIVDAGQGQYFALRLDTIRPAALPPLAEVRGPLAQRWTQRENARRLSTRAEALASRVRGGEDIAAVAASAGATLTTRTAIQQTPQTQEELGQGLLQGLFGQANGQAFTGPASETAFVVGRVDGIRAATPALAAPIAEQVRGRLSEQLVNDMGQTSLAAAAARAKASNDPALALSALGVTAPAAATPAPATPAPAK